MTRRLIPFVFILYIFNFLDRSNVGLAALQMNRDLGFSAAAFSFGAGIFFLGYSLFEVPSNLVLVRVGARRWIARIMITWGAIATGLMFVRTPTQFYVLRLLLGVAEAGFFPAIMYYLSQWYPASMRARSSAWFMMAIPLSGTIGGPLGGWLLNMNGRSGLAGWQWLFLIEGVPSVVLGLVVLRYLTEEPRDADWLTAAQHDWLVERLRRDRDEHPAPHGVPPLRALAHPLIWLVSIPEMLITTAGYAYLFWGPTMLRDSLHLGNLAVGWLTALIAVLCALGMVLVGASSDRSGERVLHAAACAVVVAIACTGAATFSSPVARMTSLAVAEIAVISFLAPFWTLPTILLSGSSAAVGIALVNAIGNVAGFVGPNVVGFLRTHTGGDSGAFLTLAAFALVAAAICLGMRGKVPRPDHLAASS
ncbi:MAG TPA: MFS transporter [Gemmatimonadaceae bacterium]|nr:MFS transporter [Gemmatimonadaceae bacterium]